MTNDGPPGLFLSLDGPDGGGKTTQAARLAEWLRGRGETVVTCRDPGGTELGDRLRALVLERHAIRIDMHAEMLLYMASRAQLVREVIRPALDAGQVVVSDRFLLANVVYQGYAGGLAIDDVWTVGHVATGGLLPDLTLLLDVPRGVANGRIGAPRDRMEDRSASYRDAVRLGFLSAAALYPAQIKIIDATSEPDAVASRIQEEVAYVLARRARA
jgi:dTMP kinase